MIAKLIPSLENLEFSVIKSNLEIIQQGITKYSKLHSND
jgi:hypothetical protein